MVRKCTFRRARLEDAADLGPRLRAEDVAELQAVHGLEVDTVKILEQAIGLSGEDAWAAVTFDGELAFLFGCATHGDMGAPWLLGSDKTRTLFRELLVDGRFYVGQWKKKVCFLANYVDIRNKSSVRWLKRLGFDFHEPAEFGVMKMPFHLFTMEGQKEF